MSLLRALARGVAVTTVGTTAALAIGLTPAWAEGPVPAEEHCVTADGAVIVCVTVGAELFVTHAPSSPDDNSFAGLVKLTIGCRTANGTLCPPTVVDVPVDQTGFVRGTPDIDLVESSIHVPRLCVDDICAPPLDIPVLTPVVSGTIATLYVNGTSVPVNGPGPCTVDCIDPGTIEQIVSNLVGTAQAIANAALRLAGQVKINIQT